MKKFERPREELETKKIEVERNKKKGAKEKECYDKLKNGNKNVILEKERETQPAVEVTKERSKLKTFCSEIIVDLLW